MLSQHLFELGKPPWILVLELDTGWADRIALGKSLHVTSQEHLGNQIGLCTKRIALLKFGAITTASNAQRQCAVMMTQAKMKCRKPAHGQTDNVSSLLADVVQHGKNIISRTRLRI